MATITFSCSTSDDSAFKNAAKLRVTYTAKNGSLAITEIEGIRSDGNHTYDLTAKNISFKVNSQVKTISLSKGVDFDSNYTAFGASRTIWDDLPETSLDITITMPSSEASFSNARFTGNIAMTYDRYTISYDANGGSNAPNTQTKVYDSILYLSENKPVKEGYEFIQWVSVNPNMTLQPGDVISYNGNLNLTAEWAATAWLKNKIITIETLGALHEYNKNTFATEDSASELREELGAIESRITPIENGGTNSADGATGLANLFAAGNTVLSSYQYGDELPDAGIAGRIFFKRLIEE